MYRQAAQSWPHHDSCRPQKPSQNQRSVRREDVLDHAGTALHTHTHTERYTHTHTHTHTHTRCVSMFYGDIQSVCATALHLPYT